MVRVAVATQLGYILVAQPFEEGHLIPEPISKEFLSSFALRTGLVALLIEEALIDDLPHEHLFFLDIPANKQLLIMARIQRNVHHLVALVDCEEHLVSTAGGGTAGSVSGGLGHLNHYNPLEIKTVKRSPFPYSCIKPKFPSIIHSGRAPLAQARPFQTQKM